jgi:hypothetical protein
MPGFDMTAFPHITCMRHLQLATAFSILLAAPVMAQVDPKIHKLCIEAKDYAGCVKTMTGEATSPQRTIIQQGADIAEGNQCPVGWAYVGGGNCSEVQCLYPRRLGGGGRGHDPRVAGKGWKCGGMGLFSWAGVLRLEGLSRATVNPSCPEGEPPLGNNSTCPSTEYNVQSAHKVSE